MTDIERLNGRFWVIVRWTMLLYFKSNVGSRKGNGTANECSGYDNASMSKEIST